ncbi:MAG: alpha-1,3-galactosidase B [Muribaculaceae bacterium]
MKKAIMCIAFSMLITSFCAQARTYNLADYGVTPTADSLAVRIARALDIIKRDAAGTPAKVRLPRGTYNLRSTQAPVHEYYISNHDQVKDHPVGIAIEDWQNLTFDGCGSTLLCSGRMLPISIVRCSNVAVQQLNIDFDHPQIAQVTITNSTDEGITFIPSDEVQWSVDEKGTFYGYGLKWEANYFTGIAFNGEHGYIVPQTSDLSINLRNCTTSGNQVTAPNWKDSRLVPGTRVAMRSYHRPHPGIFLEENTSTLLKNIKVHYAEGMGVVAQRCTDIHLSHVDVCLPKGKRRYFTTQADATHFVQCRGRIVEENSLYEGMMDDAINVHGVYLRVRERIDSRTVRACFEHNQSWGYSWGDEGDTVIVVRSATMDQLPWRGIIRSIKPSSGVIAGTKDYVISFDCDLPAEVTEKEGYGLENLTWTPEVVFRGCTVRNNRARGALFSSPRATICEKNLFDHTSGTAILLCGDCNGWYESGAVRNLVIRRNRFVNSLTNMFQFTNAVISIYPEIPQLKEAKTYFHGGTPSAIRIEDNLFDTFDHPLIYAKSVDGLVVKGNKVKYNTDFKPFHWNKQSVLMEHCSGTSVQEFPALPATK